MFILTIIFEKKNDSNNYSNVIHLFIIELYISIKNEYEYN